MRIGSKRIYICCPAGKGDIMKKDTRIKILIFNMAVILFMSCMPLQVQAQSESISYIYHQHTGSPGNGGDCYRQPIYHVHKGDVRSGGACYNSIIYHRHIGNAEEQGGCYNVPVCHIHQGSGNTEGGCYIKKYHAHSAECYAQSSCTVTLVKWIDLKKTWQKYCFHHGETAHGMWDVTVEHSACGAGHVRTSIEVCNACRHYPPQKHNYTVQACTRGNEVIGYEPGCGMDETTIVGYGIGCMKEEGSDIDGYGLSCGKTGETIDGYSLSCEIDTSAPLGGVKITNLTEGKAETVLLEASYWDNKVSETLKVSSEPFTWHNASTGARLGTGSRLTVRKNGTFTVTLQIDNQDVKKDSLSASIRVDNIYNAGDGGNNGNGNGGNNDGGNGGNNGGGNGGNNGGGNGSNNGGGNGGNNGGGNGGNNDGGNGGINGGGSGGINGGGNNNGGSNNGGSGNSSGNGNGKAGGTGNSGNKSGGSGNPRDGSGWDFSGGVNRPSSAGKYASATPRGSGFTMPDRSGVTPSPTPEDYGDQTLLEEESGTVHLAEIEARGSEGDADYLTSSASSGLLSPAAWAFVLTLIGLTVILILAALWFLLFRYVGIYGEDSEGGDCFLGFGRIRRSEGFWLLIPEHVMDRACTSRYCLRPGILFVRMHGQTELAIEVKTRKILLPVEKEMRFKY